MEKIDPTLYERSKSLLENVKKNNRLVWLYVESYLTGSIINKKLNKLEGDLSNIKFKHKKDVYREFFSDFFLDQHFVKNKEKAFEIEPVLQTLPATYKQFFRHYALSLQSLIVDEMENIASDLVVYRGYSSKEIANSLADNPAYYVEGQIITNWSFLSCSFDANVAAQFAIDEACCMLKIKVPKGYHGLLVSAYPGDRFAGSKTHFRQSEIVLPMGTTLLVRQPARRVVFFPRMRETTVDVVEMEVIGRMPVSI